MIETAAIIWLWVTAVALFLVGAGLFLLIMIDEVPYSPYEKRLGLFQTGTLGLAGLVLIVLLVAS